MAAPEELKTFQEDLAKLSRDDFMCLRTQLNNMLHPKDGGLRRATYDEILHSELKSFFSGDERNHVTTTKVEEGLTLVSYGKKRLWIDMRDGGNSSWTYDGTKGFIDEYDMLLCFGSLHKLPEKLVEEVLSNKITGIANVYSMDDRGGNVKTHERKMAAISSYEDIYNAIALVDFPRFEHKGRRVPYLPSDMSIDINFITRSSTLTVTYHNCIE